MKLLTDTPASEMSDKSSLDKEHGTVGSSFKGQIQMVPP